MFSSEQFIEYINLDCDRLSFLRNYLKENGVETNVIELGEKKHISVQFPPSAYDPTFRTKTVVCHYDRVPGVPGANDNSAANCAVADFAVRLSKLQKAHNVRIFFTDGEELGANGISEQGAFALAAYLKQNRIAKDEVYVFDSCGRGTVAILGQAGLLSKTSTDFKKSFFGLYKRAEELLQKTSPNSWMSLPMPYSDNAGFLAQGVPAVVITFLPKEEATLYYKNLMADKNLSKIVLNCDMHYGEKCSTDIKIEMMKYKEKIPFTWRLFHTEMDNFFSVMPESFELLGKILDELGRMVILA
ncbi:MAG: M28 family peptidase [Treponema sp.]|nr:M28 family peptidase [Treponema sp.]